MYAVETESPRLSLTANHPALHIDFYLRSFFNEAVKILVLQLDPHKPIVHLITLIDESVGFGDNRLNSRPHQSFRCLLPRRPSPETLFGNDDGESVLGAIIKPRASIAECSSRSILLLQMRVTFVRWDDTVGINVVTESLNSTLDHV